MADAAPRVGIGTKLLYGLGAAAFGIKDNGFTVFLLFFYNEVLGLSATLVGLAIAIAIVADAVFDPIVGEISDNWRARLGRRHPFMYASAIPVAVLYFFLWNPPHWSGVWLFAYLVVFAVAVRIAIACNEIPSGALAPELTSDYDGRTALLGFRGLFNAFGGGIMLLVTLTIFLPASKAHPIGLLNRSGYAGYSIAAALAMAAVILISAAGTHSRIKSLRKPPPRPRMTLGAITREMVETLSHRSLLVITISGLFSGMAGGMGSALNTYFATYFWKFTPQQLSVLGLAAAIAILIAVSVAPSVSARFGKKQGMIVCAFASLFFNNITMALKMAGFLTATGNTLLLIFFVNTLIGITFVAIATILVTSMIADVTEDNELRTGRRAEGLISAALSFVAKATSGLGLLAGSVLLDLVHFPTQAPPDVVAREAPHAVHTLVLIYMPVQLVLWFIAVALVGGYRIDRKTHEENLKKLADAAALTDLVPIPGIGTGGSESPDEIEIATHRHHV